MEFYLSNIFIGIACFYHIHLLAEGRKGESLLEILIIIVGVLSSAVVNIPFENHSTYWYRLFATSRVFLVLKSGGYISALILFVIYARNFYLLSKLRNFMYRVVPQLDSVERGIRTMFLRLVISNYQLLNLIIIEMPYSYLFGILFILFPMIMNCFPFPREILYDVIIVLGIEMMNRLLQNIESVRRIAIRFEDGFIAVIELPETEGFFPRVLFKISFLASLFQSALRTFGPITSKIDDLRRWEKVKYLGSGTFGEVHEGVSLITGRRFAVKRIEYARNGGHMSTAMQEIEILSGLNHPNIVRYYGARKSDSILCIFLELMDGGSLRSIYHNNGAPRSFTYDEVKAYTKQILRGLGFLHQNRVIHRDLKCDNILINSDGDVKIADFGLADKINTGKVINVNTGTPGFKAPEVVREDRYNFKADIWSLGCTVLEMSIGKYPSGNLVKDLSCIPPSSSSITILRDFIERCLEPDPTLRPDVDDLLKHPLVSEDI